MSIKKLLPLFMDGELDINQREVVRSHLADCPACQKELRVFEQSWADLKKWKSVEPQPGLVSRFGTRRQDSPWHERLWEGVLGIVQVNRWNPAYAALAFVLLVGAFTMKTYLDVHYPVAPLTSLSPEEAELVENMDLAENLNIIEDLEFLEDLDVVEQMDVLKVSLGSLKENSRDGIF